MLVGSPSIIPLPGTRTMASSTPTPSPRLSTLRRKGAELFSESSFSSSNPFEPDDLELGERGCSSRSIRGANPWATQRAFGMSTRASPLRVLPGEDDELAGESTTSSESPPTDVISNTPAPSPRISTFRRQAAEVLAGSSYSSANPFEADAIEFGHGQSPRRGHRASAIPDNCRAPVVSTRSSPLKQKGEISSDKENDQVMTESPTEPSQSMVSRAQLTLPRHRGSALSAARLMSCLPGRSCLQTSSSQMMMSGKACLQVGHCALTRRVRLVARR
jgi:hypothetical protein